MECSSFLFACLAREGARDAFLPARQRTRRATPQASEKADEAPNLVDASLNDRPDQAYLE